jgi:putative membrane protein
MKPGSAIFTWIFALLSSALVAAGPQLTGEALMPADNPDASFIKQAGAGGLAEVELSALALESADSPEVRRFAQEMIDAHTRSNNDLRLVSARQKLALPGQLDDEHARLRAKLEGLQGPAFDAAYMDAMVEDHERMLALLERAQGTSSDRGVKKFVRNTLPVVRHHLAMAQAIHRQ